LLLLRRGRHGFGPADVWTLFHSYAFDFSVWEIWGALLYGGRLVVVPSWVTRDPAAFRKLLVEERVTVLNQTPSAFRLLEQSDLGEPASDYALRYIVFCGEALELHALRPWIERYGDARPELINMYGITETTMVNSYRPIRLADIDGGKGSVIGKPIPGQFIRLLDQHGAPVPVGVPGEIYLGGAGVARGYLNRPELTAARFIDDPFDASGEGRLYRTGDLARRLADGDLEYLGRIDHQVKIRGFRIEPGEIEAALRKQPAIFNAIVAALEAGPGDLRTGRLCRVSVRRGTDRERSAQAPQARATRKHDPVGRCAVTVHAVDRQRQDRPICIAGPLSQRHTRERCA